MTLALDELYERTRARVETIRAERDRVARTNPVMLADYLDPHYVRRAHLDVIGRAFQRVATGEVDRLLIQTPPQVGKLIADDTPVPTPDGWTNHGDLQPGDWVMHPSGTPVRVIDVHEPDVASVLVRTRSGAEIKVHPRHEWTIWDRARHVWDTVETSELMYGLRPNRPSGRGWNCNTHTWGDRRISLRQGGEGRGGRWRFQLPWQDRFDLKPADLPVDPYTLGVWLGDGSTTKPAITHDPGDEYEIPYPVRVVYTHATTGVLTTYYDDLFPELLNLGVATRSYGVRSKHIPTTYLRASDEQRWDLLCGIVDSDGTITPEGQIIVTGSDTQLMHDIAELVRTFGYRPTVRTKQPTTSSSGIVGKKPIHIVQFTPHDGRYPARLARKLNGIRGEKSRTRGKVMRRRDAITSVEPCEPVPGRCITVDSADGLYLVGEHMIPTHNSVSAAVWGPFWWLVNHPRHRVVLASYADSLAVTRGRAVRRLVAEHGHRYDIALDPESRAANDWSLLSGGGIRACGVGAGLTGFSSSILVCDDPHKDRAEADSLRIRDNIWDWWSSTAITRLAPGAPIVLIQTRWHRDDLAGRVLEREGAVDEGGRWHVLNMPALATASDDPLGRAPGEPLPHPLLDPDDHAGLRAHWEDKRATMIVRDWYALCMGDPQPAEGALVDDALMRRQTHTPPPAQPVKAAVAIDPSGGGRDTAGVVGGYLADDGRVYLSHDATVHGPTEQWSEAAVHLAAELDAEVIIYESNYGGDQVRWAIRSAWEKAQREHPNDARFARVPPQLVDKRAKKGKLLRAEPIAQQLAEDRVRLAAHLPELIGEWTSWQPTDPDSPGRIDASVYLVYGLLPIPGQDTVIASPAGIDRGTITRPAGTGGTRIERGRGR